MGKVVAIVLALSIVLGVLFWKFAPNFSSKKNEQVILNFWGLWENDAFIKVAISDYQKLNPKVTINYKHEVPVNYRQRVQTQIAAGQGPDIFAIHNSWLGEFLQYNYLSGLPESVMNADEYKSTFYKIALDSFSRQKGIYALPLEIDGLSLYYNEDILKAAGVNPPAYWSDFIDSAIRMTVRDSGGNIKTSGAALGSTNNIEYWPDILGLLFSQQPGVSLEKPASSLGADVLTFYTNFITDPRRKTWDVTMEEDTQAFEEGKLAFYFAPSKKVNEIKAASPALNFKVAPVPQLPGHDQVTWASFWGLGVSVTSQNQDEAWKFLKFLTSAQEEKALYQIQLQGKLIGLPYSRVDLQSELLTDPYAGAFVVQGPYYKSWYLTSGTQDAGLDEEIINEYQTAVNGVLAGQDASGVLQNIQGDIQKSIDKFTKPPSPSPTP